MTDMLVEITDTPGGLIVRAKGHRLTFSGAHADAIRTARELYADDATATAAFWRGLLLLLNTEEEHANGKAGQG